MSDTNDENRFQAVDETGDPIATDDAEDPRNEPVGPTVGPNGREVVVPFRLYKTVTTFSTLAAVVAYFIGFTLIDAATLQVSFIRATIVYVLETIAVAPSEGALTAILAIAGIGLILFGTAVYVLGTRFRAQGMGKAQEDSSED